jgi:2,4-dienoyl-CoA reductase (NADPH2)
VDYTAEVKQHVSVPVIASNRINMPDVAEEIIASGKGGYGANGTTIPR